MLIPDILLIHRGRNLSFRVIYAIEESPFDLMRVLFSMTLTIVTEATLLIIVPCALCDAFALKCYKFQCSLRLTYTS